MNTPAELVVLTPDALRSLVADAVAEALAAWTPPASPLTITPSDADELMGRAETARFLRVSTSALSLWEKRGRLVPVRIGRKVLYRRGDVLAALDRDQKRKRGAA